MAKRTPLNYSQGTCYWCGARTGHPPYGRGMCADCAKPCKCGHEVAYHGPDGLCYVRLGSYRDLCYPECRAAA